MNRSFLFFVSFIVFCNLSYCQRKVWKLIWSDEFNYSGLPDTTKWGFFEGYPHDFEKQYCTKKRLSNAKVENGCLIITARKEEFVNKLATDYERQNHGVDIPIKYRNIPSDSVPAWVKNRFDRKASYTSAFLESKQKAQWNFGRIDVRAKLPRGLGTWPAIWMMGSVFPKTKWPDCGEIDIMEHLGWDSLRIHSNVHFGNSAEKEASHKGIISSNDLSSTFHVYSIEWNSEEIVFYFDNKAYNTFKISDADRVIIQNGALVKNNPFKSEFYLILNFALGGWGGKIDDSILPQDFRIDYVRVYQ